MLKIRLSRTGKKSQPSFRVLVQEHSAAVKGGKVVENLGYYKHAADPKEFKVDLDRVKYWLSVGAQPSDTVAVLLKSEGVDGMDKFIAPRDKQRKKKKEVEEAPAPAAEAAPAESAEGGGEATESAPEAPAKEAAKEEAPAKEATAEPAAEESKEDPKKEAPPEEEKTETTPAEKPESEKSAEKKTE
ncbi:30S ribosomal protein S16 [Candidatus Peregrinibacteria bacterium]|nr:30S ribosomal protein S16 [Candidatus Peregrinibacteria bacterium]